MKNKLTLMTIIAMIFPWNVTFAQNLEGNENNPYLSTTADTEYYLSAKNVSIVSFIGALSFRIATGYADWSIALMEPEIRALEVEIFVQRARQIRNLQELLASSDIAEDNLYFYRSSVARNQKILDGRISQMKKQISISNNIPAKNYQERAKALRKLANLEEEVSSYREEAKYLQDRLAKALKTKLSADDRSQLVAKIKKTEVSMVNAAFKKRLVTNKYTINSEGRILTSAGKVAGQLFKDDLAHTQKYGLDRLDDLRSKMYRLGEKANNRFHKAFYLTVVTAGAIGYMLLFSEADAAVVDVLSSDLTDGEREEKLSSLSEEQMNTVMNIMTASISHSL